MAKVLVIDDDYRLRNLLCTILEQEGHDAYEAPNGLAGIEHQRREPVDLLVTDIFMPEEDGLGTIIEFQEKSPDVKIVAISGGGSVESVDFLELAKNLGASRVMQKPFNCSSFLEVVKEVLG